MRTTCTFSVPWPWLVLLLSLLAQSEVQASITVMETGKEFASRPEKKLGHQLWKGSEYMGRMQFVHGNLQLCKSAQDLHRRFSITESMDGLPVAIYAKAGGCTLEEKAFVASTLLDPPNIVGYLIVDDERSGRKKKKKSGPSKVSLLPKSEFLSEEEDDLLDDFIDSLSETEIDVTDEDLGTLWEELMIQVQNQPNLSFESRTLAPLDMEVIVSDQTLLVENLVNDDETAPPVASKEIVPHSITDDTSASDDEMVSFPLERFRIQSDENAWWRGGDEIQGDDGKEIEENREYRKLKHHRESESDNINVAILHVSNRVGYDLLDLLLKENSEMGRLGGPKILLNSKEPNATASTIFAWTMISIAVSACMCCCMLVFVEYLGEEEQHTPQQPVRRRLTTDQVRENFPAFHYHPGSHDEQTLDDECAICLDDFTEGMRLRKLPCGHVFHSTCISRWLIERSAVCPLCKVDLYEAEEQEGEENIGHATALQQRYGAFQVMTSWLSHRSEPTANAASRFTSILPWWTRSRLPNPAVAAPNVDTSTVPTAPPAGAFQWRYSMVPATPTEGDGQEGGAEASTSPLAAAGRWFTRRRRRGTAASGMLTELTEPLMATGNATSGDEGASTIANLTPDIAETTPLTPVGDLPSRGDIEAPTSSTEVQL